MKSDIESILETGEEIQKMMDSHQYELIEEKIKNFLMMDYMRRANSDLYENGIYASYLSTIVEKDPALKDLYIYLEQYSKDIFKAVLKGV